MRAALIVGVCHQRLAGSLRFVAQSDTKEGCAWRTSVHQHPQPRGRANDSNATWLMVVYALLSHARDCSAFVSTVSDGKDPQRTPHRIANRPSTSFALVIAVQA
jgi:hypothetical protein